MSKVKYRFSKYNVSFNCKIKIDVLKSILFCKRLLRTCKRLFMYLATNVVSISIMLFCLIVVVYLGFKYNVYSSISDAFWDIKDLIITNILLIFFMTIYNEEKQRHYGLIYQYELYQTLVFYSEMYISTLLKDIGYEFKNNIFIDEDNVESLKKQILNIKISNKKSIRNNYLSCHKLFTKKIKRCIYNYTPYKLVGVNHWYINTDIFELWEECEYDLYNINNNIFGQEFIINYLISIIDILYLLISEYRRPWRWDINIDKKIRLLLKSNSKVCINHFDILEYYSDVRLIKK